MDSTPVRLHALVTGASRGIGRAIAQQLAERGCRVVVHYHRNRVAADDTMTSLRGEGHVAISADVGSEAGVTQLWREASASLGRVDILVNNAGIYLDHPPLTTAGDAWMRLWRDTLATNLLGPAQLCHLAANAMVHASPTANARLGRGRIVNISSRGAFRGEPHAPAYGASKAGLNALSQSLARALASEQIYVFCLAPGWVDTEMAADYLNGPRRDEILSQHPLGRVATADEIARTAVFCALDAPATMTGSVIDINGASHLRT